MKVCQLDDNVALPDDLLVDPDELRHGDQIVALNYISPASFDPWSTVWTFVDRYAETGQLRVKDEDGEPATLTIRIGDRIWIRARQPTVIKTEYRNNTRWNGRCGRCGSNTYTSSLFVEHEGGDCR